MKLLIDYLKSVVRAVICGLVYLSWFNSGLKPEALAAGNAAVKPLSYYIAVPFSSCLFLVVTITFLHHIMTVPLNWTAAWFPKWVSRDFNSRKRWYWPAWDSWREGINAGIVCLVGLVWCSFFWIVSIVHQYEMLSDPNRIGLVISLLILFNKDLANTLINLVGGDLGGQIQQAKDMIAPALSSDLQKMKIEWLIIATFLYQYLRRDTQPYTAPKTKTKTKKKTQTPVEEIDPIEQELNKLSAEMGAVKTKPVSKKTKPKP
ncbi:MAG TPA: hypothetical protein VK211_24150 [Kamptonema sp.]|nr:hypothetical protein [Kamptonema sp.]